MAGHYEDVYHQVVAARRNGRTLTRLETVVRGAPHVERSMASLKHNDSMGHSLS